MYIPIYNLPNPVVIVHNKNIVNTSTQQESTLSVSSSTTTSTCYINPQTQQTIATQKIVNGTNYYYTTNKGAAAGNSITQTIYRTIKNGICLEIALSIESSSDSNYTDNPQQTNNYNNFISISNTQLNQILSTFKFTQ